LIEVTKDPLEEEVFVKKVRFALFAIRFSIGPLSAGSRKGSCHRPDPPLLARFFPLPATLFKLTVSFFPSPIEGFLYRVFALIVLPLFQAGLRALLIKEQSPSPPGERGAFQFFPGTFCPPSSTFQGPVPTSPPRLWSRVKAGGPPSLVKSGGFS